MVDFFPRPNKSSISTHVEQTRFRETVIVQDELKKWLVRRVVCVRGALDIGKLSACFMPFVPPC